MSQESKNKDKFPRKLVKIISFSTNHEGLSPQNIISNYLSALNIQNVPLNKPLVEYEREIHFMNIHIKFLCLELLVDDEVDQKQFVTLCGKAQTFMFFIDLEYDKSFYNLESIIDFIRNKIDPDFKIFIYGVYKDKSNIQSNINEKKLENYLDSQRIFFHYSEVDLNDIETLIKIFDSVAMEGINNMSENPTNNVDDGQSSSKCNIL